VALEEGEEKKTFFPILTIEGKRNQNTKRIVKGFVAKLAQVATALRLASVQFNSSWHKQEDGQSVLRSERSRNRRVAGPYVPIRRLVRSSVWFCVYTRQWGSDLDGFLQNLVLVICTKQFSRSDKPSNVVSMYRWTQCCILHSGFNNAYSGRR